MFKFTGCFILCFSTFFIIYSRSISDWFTYIFLFQTTEIFRHMLFVNKTAVTYPEIFADLSAEKLWIYSNFDFTNQNNFFCELEKCSLITTSEIYKVKGMFSQLGYRTAQQENEYILQCINQLYSRSEFYRDKYLKNNKINRMCGISAGIVLILILI